MCEEEDGRLAMRANCFIVSQFLGVWYEAERYFQLTEVVSRCVMANYTLAADGKFRVSNEVTNRL